jgi:hypothetical protein
MLSARFVADPLLASFYAWLCTVQGPAWSSGTPARARLFSTIAMAIMCAGWALAPKYSRWAGILGTAGFCGACVVTWMTLGPERLAASLEPAQVILGMVGWSLTALAVCHSQLGFSSRSLSIAVQQTPDQAQRSSATVRWSQPALLTFALLLWLAILVPLGTPRSDGHGVMLAAVVVALALLILASVGDMADKLCGQRWQRNSRVFAVRVALVMAAVALGGILIAVLGKR